MTSRAGQVAASQAPAEPTPTPSSPPPFIGRMGRYILVRLLGMGGMGAVYEAYDPQLDRRVAIKILREAAGEFTQASSELARASLVNEARSLARLSHPNIVPIYDVGTLEDQRVFLSMEFVAGQTLHQYLQQEARSWLADLELVLDAGAGLAAAHEAGILHRDFKPENVVIGNDGRVRVLDFGLATEEHSSTKPLIQRAPVQNESSGIQKGATSTTLQVITLGDSRPLTTVAGTPAYMAPEQIEGYHASQATDLFALCTVLFEVLNRKRPFPWSNAQARLAAIRAGELQWTPRVPRWLRETITRGLSFREEDRGPGVAQWIAEIRRELQRRKQRKILRLWGSAGGVLLLSLTTLYTLSAETSVSQCDTLDQKIAATWNDSVRANLAKEFEHSGLRFASSLFEESSVALNTWRDRWTQSASELCKTIPADTEVAATHAAVQIQGNACLEESRIEVATLLEIWRNPSNQQILESSTALRSLSDPRDCTDLEKLRARAPLPADPDQRRIVLTQYEKLAETRLRIGQGDIEGSRKRLQELTQENQLRFDLGVQSALASAAAKLAFLELEEGVASSTALERAFLWNLAADRPQQMAEDLLQLWGSRVYRGGLISEGDERLSSIIATSNRAGMPTSLAQGIQRIRGLYSMMRGDLRSALRYFGETLQQTIEASGPESLAAAAAYDTRCFTEFLMGQRDEAIADCERSLTIRREKLPMGHPERIRGSIQLGHVLTQIGLPARGQDAALTGWQDCAESGIDPIRCNGLVHIAMQASSARGDFALALDLAQYLLQLEAEMGLRLEPLGPFVEQRIGEILLARGELQAASLVSNIGLAKLRAEQHLHRSALVEGLFQMAQLELALEHPTLCANSLEEIETILALPSEDSLHFQIELAHLRGRLFLALGQPDLALASLATCVAPPDASRTSEMTRATCELDTARAWLERGELDISASFANNALTRRQALQGREGHELVQFLQVLAQISIAQDQTDLALRYLDQAQDAFDAKQVDNNRRAELFFIAAQAWAKHEDSAQARAHSHALAQHALAEFSSWDKGATKKITELRAWLQKSSSTLAFNSESNSLFR